MGGKREYKREIIEEINKKTGKQYKDLKEYIVEKTKKEVNERYKKYIFETETIKNEIMECVNFAIFTKCKYNIKLKNNSL